MANDDQIAIELRKMTRLLAVGLLEGTQRDKILRLSAAHFAAKEIAETLGIPLNTVTSDISRLKGKAGKRKKGQARPK